MARWAALLVGAACALGACDERLTAGPAPVAAADIAGCAAHASGPWRPLRGIELRVSAETSGAACADAIASITLQSVDGQTLYREALPAAQVMTLAYAENEQAMQVALAEWIDPTRSNLRASSELPVWTEGAEQPVLGEFPFYPEHAFDREAYAALRTRDVPVFCFVQGMESLACLALQDGALTKIGVQTFPG